MTDLLLLLLRCAALMLLAFAFARPYFADIAAGSEAPATLVALDTSFSMAAAETWRAAQAEALKTIDGAPAGGPVAVLAFDDGRARGVPGQRGPQCRQARRRAVAAGGRRHGPRRGRAARARSSSTAAPGTLVIVTDRQRSGLSGAVRVPDNVQVRFAGVPAARENLAVSDIRREGAALEATIVNGGLADRQTEVSLRVDGESVARQPQLVAGGASRGRAVRSRGPREGRRHGRGVRRAGPAGRRRADVDPGSASRHPRPCRSSTSRARTRAASTSVARWSRRRASSRCRWPTSLLPAARLPEFGPADRPDVYRPAGDARARARGPAATGGGRRIRGRPADRRRPGRRGRRVDGAVSARAGLAHRGGRAGAGAARDRARRRAACRVRGLRGPSRGVLPRAVRAGRQDSRRTRRRGSSRASTTACRP